MIRFLEAQRLRRQLHQRASTSSEPRQPAHEPQALHLERPRRVLVGRRSARTSRPRATPASTSPSSAATRCSGRRAGSRAPTASARPTARSSPTRTRTSTRAPGPGRVDRAPGATRASRPPPEGVKPENALTGQSFLVNSRHVAHHGARRLRQAAHVAQHRRREPDLRADACSSRPTTLGYEWDDDADNGFRPAGQFRLSSTTVSGVEVFTDYGSTTNAQRHGHAQPDACTARRAARACSAPAPSSGPGASTTDNPDGNAGRPQHAAGDGEPVRRHGRPAGDAAVRPDGAPRRRPTPPRRPRRITVAAEQRQRRHAGRRSPARRPTPAAASSPASRSRPTAARTWHPATGTTSWSYAWTAHGSPSTTIKVRAVDDSGNLADARRRRHGHRQLPVLALGHEHDAPAADADSGDTDAGRGRRQVQVRHASAPSPASASTRRRPTPARTSAACGRADGTRLAQATFTGETASGWQTVTFASPVAGPARTRPTSPPTTRPTATTRPRGDYF